MNEYKGIGLKYNIESVEKNVIKRKNCLEVIDIMSEYLYEKKSYDVRMYKKIVEALEYDEELKKLENLDKLLSYTQNIPINSQPDSDIKTPEIPQKIIKYITILAESLVSNKIFSEDLTIETFRIMTSYQTIQNAKALENLAQIPDEKPSEFSPSYHPIPVLSQSFKSPNLSNNKIPKILLTLSLPLHLAIKFYHLQALDLLTKKCQGAAFNS